MATVVDLMPRVLRKLGVLGESQAPSAQDALLAQEKLRAVHVALKAEDGSQWTLNDIPDFAEEPYVCMAAFLLGPEYGRPMPDQWAIGRSLLASSTQLRSVGRVTAEYF